MVDANAIIAGDPRIQSWDAETLKLIFTREYWYPEATSDLYRPLTTLSYWVNYTLLGGGTRVLGYHVVNFALHWANVLFVLAIVNRIGKRFTLAVITAALFAVHPVNVESVTNVVGRADLLATFAVLCGGWCYLNAADNGATRKPIWLAAMGAMAFLGVFTKESAVGIGGFVLLYDLIWRVPSIKAKTAGERARAAWAAYWPGYAALIPAALAIIVVRVVIHYHTPLFAEQFAANPIAGAAWFPGFMTAWKVFARYVGLLVFPKTLSNDYSYNQIPLYFESLNAWENAQAWVGLLLAAGAVWVAWRARRKNPIVAWSIAFFFVALLPTSNLLTPIGSIMAERFLYLPSVGFCVVAAYALLALGDRFARARSLSAGAQPRVAFVAAALVTGALGARAHVRNKDWHDDRSLWASAVIASPSSARVYQGYASSLLPANQDEATIDTAIMASEQGLAILVDPPLPIERRDAGMYVDLGIYYRLKAQRLKARGRGAEASTFLQNSLTALARAREVDEWFNKTSRSARVARGKRVADIPDVGFAGVYHELGDTYLELADFPAAQAAARYAERLAPDAPRGYQIEGVSLFYARHPDGAAVEFAAALLLDPTRKETWDNLASCFQAMGQTAPVIERNGQKVFNVSSPVGRQLVDAAGAALAESFAAAKRPDDATRWTGRVRAYR